MSHSKTAAAARKGRKRSYPGERTANSLIAWLNEPDMHLKKMLANPTDGLKTLLQQNKAALIGIAPAVRERRERVEKIIGSWQSFTEDAAELHQWHRNTLPAGKVWTPDGERKIRVKLDRARNRINSLLRRYAGRRQLIGVDYTGKSMVKIVGPDKFNFGGDYDVRDREREWNSIGAIADLAGMGLLGKVQRCEQCARWLFKRFPHQTCCSGGKCRQDKYRSSPQWKEHRRKWQRENYHTNKEIDLGRAPPRN